MYIIDIFRSKENPRDNFSAMKRTLRPSSGGFDNATEGLTADTTTASTGAACSRGFGRAGKLWMTAVNRNQAESIITRGSLPRDSTNRQWVRVGMGKHRGNLMGNSTSSRGGRVAASPKCVARKKRETSTEESVEEKREIRERGGVSIKPRGFLSPQVVNMKFLWRSRKTYRFVRTSRRGLSISGTREPGRPQKRAKDVERENERERNEKERLQRVAGRSALYEVIVKGCEMHIFLREERVRCKGRG